MKFTSTFAALSLLGLGSARPATAVARDDTDRVLPGGWEFKIASLKGPGCPDFGLEDGANGQRATRLTYGQNTIGEIYHWFIAYPSLRVELGKTESIWCETELSYLEYGDYHQKDAKSDFRLRLHKNATKIISTYDLAEGATATASFQYVEQGVTDTFTYNGPLASGQYQKENDMTGPAVGMPVNASTCGATTIKFRTELSISGMGTKGYVQSEVYQGNPYGTQLGFSYDWEKC